jgi:tRNA A-37 threonylcarbamoyl transferase component Bud32
MENTDVVVRSTWFSQIQNTTQPLHAADIVWGDAKAENILIDQQGETCIIDFGGGYTRGWVSEALQETKEGDLEGLQNLRKFLAL